MNSTPDSEPELSPPPSSVTAGSETKKRPKRDDFFYFHSVIFQAEDTLFKVPRYGLPSGDGVFTAMFALPTGDSEAEGSSDDKPIFLPADVTADDFRSLLRASLPRISANGPKTKRGRGPPDTLGMNVAEWMSVLKLVNMWCLDDLRTKAIEASDWMIDKKTPLEKIVLGKQYHVGKWLVDGYTALGQRKETISDEEREALGIETYVGLVTLRERSWQWAGELVGRAGELREGFNFKEKVIEIFGEELKQDKDFSYS